MKLEPGSGIFHVIQLWNVSSPRDPHKPRWYLSMSGWVVTDEAWWSSVWWRDITVVQFITQDSTTAVDWQNPLHSHQQKQGTDSVTPHVCQWWFQAHYTPPDRQTDRQRVMRTQPTTDDDLSQEPVSSPVTTNNYRTSHNTSTFGIHSGSQKANRNHCQWFDQSSECKEVVTVGAF